MPRRRRASLLEEQRIAEPALAEKKQPSRATQPDFDAAEPFFERTLTQGNALQMQRAVGNQAVRRMVQDSTTHGRGCRCSGCSIQRTIDQGHGAGCGCAACSGSKEPIQRKTVNTIQRHSSFEHKMLGDVSPDMLQIISSMQNLNENGEAVGAEVTATNDNKDTRETKTIKAIGGPFAGKTINKEMVGHVLDQEIARINYFKNQHAPVQKTNESPSDTKAAQSYEQDLKEQDEGRRLELFLNSDTGSAQEALAGNQWDLRMVAVPSIKNFEPLLVSYGEMNTLADIYGSTEELQRADPVDRFNIVQGIRQQSLFRFMDMKNKLEGKDTNDLYIGQGFEGAYGNTGRGDNVILPTGELSLILGGKKGAKAAETYSSGLARNACHFAPESWYAWADYHKKGLALAQEGHQLNQQATQVQDRNQAQALRNQAEEKLNNALIENGFGDHFLQDSFAAGHLINKTGVMQLFIRWMDLNPDKWTFMSDETWRRMQNLAYQQPGIGHKANDDHYNIDNVGSDDFHAKDAQSVENMSDTDSTWRDRFQATGLRVPSSLEPGTPEWEITVWFQERSIGFMGDTTAKFADVVKIAGGEAQAADLLRKLLRDGVITLENPGKWFGFNAQSNEERGQMLKDPNSISLPQLKAAQFRIEPSYRPNDKEKFLGMVTKYRTAASQNGATNEDKYNAGEDYRDEARKVSYGSYHTMLKQSMIQLGTNVMHNKYCKEGLEVKTGSGVALGRIYGDDNMNNSNSQQGVRFSSETSHMSRDSVLAMYEQGQEPGGKTTNEIAQRFPTMIKVGSEYKRIDAWHGSREFVDAMDEEFSAAGARAKSGFTQIKGIVSEDKISRDESVHSGQLW